jgi:hypothetical protein
MTGNEVNTMSVENLKTALASMGNGRLEDNEDATVKGVGNVYEKPDNRKPRSLDAKWGDAPAVDQDGHSAVFGTAALEASDEGRNKMVERLFSSPATMASVEQSLMRQNFENFNEAIHHSPLMQRGHALPQKEASVNLEDLTLTDQVLRVAGRR